MQDDNHSHGDAICGPGSKYEGPSCGVQLSANTTCRLAKLAHWRIDPALIIHPKGAPTFEGGCAIVSRALLGSSLGDTRDRVVESSGRKLQYNDRVAKLEGDNRGGEAEGSPEEVEHKGEGAEKREQGSYCETSGKLKAVAIKEMKVKLPDEVVRVLGLTLREAEFLVKLSHENIIKLEGFVEDVSKEMIWLVFPWEDNGNLKDFIASHDWEIPERISLIYDVTAGVGYLHSREPPIIHGDLKSINVLINSKRRAVITDFGSARHSITKHSDEERERTPNEPEHASSPRATFCPSTNTITLTCNKYTLRWAAPELLAEDDASLASDIWALGCVAYEVMTNSIPFQDVTDDVVIKRVARGDLPSISDAVRMLLIQALCNLVGQCWSINPNRRPMAEHCRMAIVWMPMVVPNPTRTVDAVDSAELFMKLGHMHRDQNDYPNASMYYSKASDVYTKIANTYSKGNAIAQLELAQIYRAQQEYSHAIASYSRALEIFTYIDHKRGRADALFGLATVYSAQDDHRAALPRYELAHAIYSKIRHANEAIAYTHAQETRRIACGLGQPRKR